MAHLEQVTGDELRVGDIIRNHGFRWKITAVSCEALWKEDGTRYCVTADEEPGKGRPKVPHGYAKGMTMGLRSDLTWTREVAEQ